MGGGIAVRARTQYADPNARLVQAAQEESDKSMNKGKRSTRGEVRVQRE